MSLSNVTMKYNDGTEKTFTDVKVKLNIEVSRCGYCHKVIPLEDVLNGQNVTVCMACTEYSILSVLYAQAEQNLV